MWRVWFREFVALILIAAGLGAAAFCVRFLSNGFIIEGGLLVPIVVIFTATGTHLFKVALAVYLSEREPRQKAS